MKSMQTQQDDLRNAAIFRLRRKTYSNPIASPWSARRRCTPLRTGRSEEARSHHGISDAEVIGHTRENGLGLGRREPITPVPPVAASHGLFAFSI
jgi:hypothetical protein